jgi:ubiquinone/menaquinone biosynthesis C-methylase UbiE
MSSIEHLSGHHGDFAAFRDCMVETSEGRFGPLWWGVWDQFMGVPESVVDLGTGPGLLLPKLRERLPNAEITGVDMQPLMLETARDSATRARARLITADLAETLPIESDSVDAVTLVMVFHELEHPPPLLDEVFRILRPGGRVLMYDWVKRPLEDYLGDKELNLGTMQHFREHCLFAGEDLEFLMRRAGFTLLERIGRRGGRFAMLVAEKPV